MCKRHLKHCYFTRVENDSRRKKEIAKHMAKKHEHILVPSQRYQDSKHILQGPNVPRNVMGFSNRSKKTFTPLIFLS